MAHDGWLNPNIDEWFAHYAGVCFEHFGSRVKNWITFNEPWVTSILGYGQGVFAPGRISKSEPYITAHHQLRAHAKAVALYRNKYQSQQNGRIAITCNADWREPLTQKPEDVEAAQRALEFYLGWFADPVWLGDYPEVMKQRLGNRLPRFTDAEKALLKGSSDFFGLNHYTTMFAANADKSKSNKASVYGNGGISEDQDVDLSVDPAWGKTEMGWTIVPWGCRKLLEWIDKRYDHPQIIITENGMAGSDQLENEQVNDLHRIEFLKGYITECHKAIDNGVNLGGYFVWSFMDNFEWALGYKKRFGIVYVDYKTLKRYPKQSALWYSRVVANNGIF
jgi:beta-glucosidase